LVRRIEISAKHVFWSDDGKLVAIAGDDSFYILKFNASAYENATASDITDDGVEEAFEIVGESTK
jgi:coatomer subunit beta'